LRHTVHDNDARQTTVIPRHSGAVGKFSEAHTLDYWNPFSWTSTGSIDIH